MTPTNDTGNGHPKNPLPELPDLPPVEAPSAGFIVQLFVIPALIVLVVIAVWLLFGKLAGGERDAMEYVRLIRASSSNPRAANRAAFELASLIQNDSKLASDPRLLGELTEVLEHHLDQADNDDMTQYVALALGRFLTLDATTANGDKVDPISALDRALDPKYKPSIRLAAAASLAKQAARLNGKLTDSRPIEALDRLAQDEDSEIRQVAVFALGFFGGEEPLKPLRERLNDTDRYVRYNAAVALARRGDPAAKGNIREMLTQSDLEKVISLDNPAESRAKIEMIELEALQALQTAVDSGSKELAQSVRTEVDGLTRSGLIGVRNNAQALLKSLPGGS